MKIVFFGTSEFAAKILFDLLKKKYEIVAVVTRSDKPQGRSLQMSYPPVKKMITSFDFQIPVLQPEKASTFEFEQILKGFNADLFLVVAYGEILKENILSIPVKGCINIHASLLPKFRGAAPIQRSILEGDSKTGVTIIEMVKKMDAGDMLAKEEVEITPNMNFEQVEQRLLDACYSIVPKVLDHFDVYYGNKQPQDEDLVTFANKITPSDLEINWFDNAEVNLNKVRAFSPYPGAFCKIKIGNDTKRIKIKNARLSTLNGSPGETIDGNKNLIVACCNGSLEILEVQLEGKKTISSIDFLRGLHHNITFN
jgi:methionyl-tRNA formyltransferase